MLDRLRLRYGMFWRGKYPPLPWREAVLFLTLLALAHILYERESLRSSLNETEYWRATWQQVVLTCLNHGAVVFDHEAFTCRADTLGDVR